VSAQVKRRLLDIMAAMREDGHPVRAARLSPDGSILLLTDTPVDALASNDDDDWVALAGAPEISRA